MDEAEKARRVDSLQFQISELENAELQRRGRGAAKAAQSAAQRREIHLALQGSDSCLNGDDEGEQPGAVTLLRQAQERRFLRSKGWMSWQSLFERLE
jgi:DNA repair protein RecN (Recombination protein N)